MLGGCCLCKRAPQIPGGRRIAEGTPSRDEHSPAFFLTHILLQKCFSLELLAKVTFQGSAPCNLCSWGFPGGKDPALIFCLCCICMKCSWFGLFAGCQAACSHGTARHGTARHGTAWAPALAMGSCATAVPEQLGSAEPRCSCQPVGLLYFSLMETHLLFYITV